MYICSYMGKMIGGNRRKAGKRARVSTIFFLFCGRWKVLKEE